jgi:hypothetical protein
MIRKLELNLNPFDLISIQWPTNSDESQNPINRKYKSELGNSGLDIHMGKEMLL